MYGRAEEYLAHEEKVDGAVPSHAKDDKDLLFQTIRNSSLPAHEKDIHRLAQEAFSVIVAGGETTARMLESGIFYIVTTPSVLKRFQDEAVRIMPDVSKTPSAKALEEVSYVVSLSGASAHSFTLMAY